MTTTRLSVLLACVVSTLAGCGGGEIDDGREQPAAVKALPVYRFAKLSNGAYFYTGSEQEKDLILRTIPDMRYEGVAFGRVDGAVPVYRFANLSNGGYFYTANASERDIVIAGRKDMRYEGTSFSVPAIGDSESQAVYRLANLNNGAYLYTASAPERDAALALGFWRYEGVAFAGYAAPAAAPVFPLDTAATRLYTNVQNYTGTASAQGFTFQSIESVVPGLDEVFEGRVLKKAAFTVTMRRNGAVLSNTSAESLFSVSPFRPTYTRSSDGSVSLVTSFQPLPAAMTIGGIGPFTKSTIYTTASRASIAGTSESTWSLEAAEAPGQAYLCINTIIRNFAGVTALTRADCYRTNPAGDFLGIRSTVTDGATTLVFR